MGSFKIVTEIEKQIPMMHTSASTAAVRDKAGSLGLERSTEPVPETSMDKPDLGVTATATDFTAFLTTFVTPPQKPPFFFFFFFFFLPPHVSFRPWLSERCSERSS